MKTVAVYGSLKLGRYNHAIISDCKFLGESTIKGTMYSLGSYPALIEDGDDEHRVELYELPDDIYLRVKRMEIGASYIEKEVDFKFRQVGTMHSYPKEVEVKAIVYFASPQLEEYCESRAEIIKIY